MRKTIAVIMLVIIALGVFNMAYLREVSGKTRSKVLSIGDGVDKMHSPLQVEPQMATDMLNLSSKLYPSLSVREQSALQGVLKDYDTNENGYAASVCDPFRDSAGNIHLAVLMFRPNILSLFNYDVIEWYILRNGETSFESILTFYFPGKLTNEYIATSINPIPDNIYATGNFCEMFNIVYFAYSGSSGGLDYSNVIFYNIETEAGGTSSSNVYDMVVARLNPMCSYIDRLFIGVDNQIKYSATAEPDDFTTAFSSGSIPLSQGGTITSLTPMRDRLLVSTDKSLFVLFGNNYETFQIALLSDNIGIKNPKCVTERNGICYFIASDGDVYEYTGNSLTNITREPTATGSKSYVKGGFDSVDIGFDSISYYNNKLYIVVDQEFDGQDEIPLNKIVSDVYVFDLVKRRWYIHNHEFDVEDTLPQIETATIVGTITKAGTVYVAITASDITGGVPYSFTVELELGDTASVVAGKIRTAMNTYTTITNKYTVGGTGADITLTRIIVGTQDSTLNIAYQNATCEGLTNDATSANTQIGGTYIAFYKNMVILGGNTQDIITYSGIYVFPPTDPLTTKIAVSNYITSESIVSADTDFEWVSPAYQLNPAGTQALSAIHFTYDCPATANIGVYVSYTVDEDDFIQVATLHKSILKQNLRQSLSIRNSKMSPWIRIKLKGNGDVHIYNMVLEWRILDRLS